MKWLSNFIKEQITEANDYKRTRQYNKLSPRMKRAVDMVFKAADRDADVIANFEKMLMQLQRNLAYKNKT